MVGEGTGQHALPDPAHALQPQAGSGTSHDHGLLEVDQQYVAQRMEPFRLGAVSRRKLGHGHELAHRRQRLLELADEALQVRVISRIVPEVLRMEQFEFLRHQIVPTDPVSLGIPTIEPDDGVYALVRGEIGELPFLCDIVGRDRLWANHKDQPISGGDGISDLLIERERA